MTTTSDILQRFHACSNGQAWSIIYTDPQEAFTECPNIEGFLWFFSRPEFPRGTLGRPMARIFRELIEADDLQAESQELIRLLATEDLENKDTQTRILELQGQIFKDLKHFDREHQNFRQRVTIQEALGLLVAVMFRPLDPEDSARMAKRINDDLVSYPGLSYTDAVEMQQKMLPLFREELSWGKVRELLDGLGFQV